MKTPVPPHARQKSSFSLASSESSTGGGAELPKRAFDRFGRMILMRFTEKPGLPCAFKSSFGVGGISIVVDSPFE
ncbi:hypothetical protein OXX79_014116, partial [Metschnikowia pulcherrima]